MCTYRSRLSIHMRCDLHATLTHDTTRRHHLALRLHGRRDEDDATFPVHHAAVCKLISVGSFLLLTARGSPLPAPPRPFASIRFLSAPQPFPLPHRRVRFADASRGSVDPLSCIHHATHRRTHSHTPSPDALFSSNGRIIHSRTRHSHNPRPHAFSARAIARARRACN
jgi:hypothetical protein